MDNALMDTTSINEWKNLVKTSVRKYALKVWHKNLMKMNDL